MWTRTLRKSLSENMAMDPNEFIKVLIVALNDKTIQDKLQDVISSDLKKEIAHLNDNLSKKDQVIKDLENKVSVLEFKYDELEQYSRRNSLRITGLSENDNEDPCETTLNLFDRMDINPKISIEDIDRVHHVGPKRGDNPRQMLIKFANYRARHRVFKARSVLRKDGRHPDRPWEQKKAATNIIHHVFIMALNTSTGNHCNNLIMDESTLNCSHCCKRYHETCVSVYR